MCKLSYYISSPRARGIQVLLNTTSFRSRDWKLKHPSLICGDNWMCRCYRSSLAAVQLRRGSSVPGLSRDIGMNVALPEVDGRIISRAVSRKLEIQIWKLM